MSFFTYFLLLVAGTLGLFFACGLLVHLISHCFSRLLGRSFGSVFDITSVIGTPVHELGHAIMCKIFGHQITAMKLWTPRPVNGVYGYVEHSYSRRSTWARFGNLFIGMGPLFSGLGVTVLVLWLCYPSLWSAYLAHSSAMVSTGALSAKELLEGLLILFRGIPASVADDPMRCILGLLIILPVSLHITLSPQDVKNCFSALPVVLAVLLIFSLATYWTPVGDTVFRLLAVYNLRLLSLFVLVIGFSLLWLALALLVRMVKVFISWF